MVDVRYISNEDLCHLNEAIKRTGDKIRFWYHLPSASRKSIFEQEVIEQTKAMSDFDKWKDKYGFLNNLRSEGDNRIFSFDVAGDGFCFS